MQIRGWVAVVGLLVPTVVWAKDKDKGPPIPVCIVGNTQDAGGFTLSNAKEISDSVEDMRSKIAGRKSLVLVESGCRLTITITDRKWVGTGARVVQRQGPFLPAKQVEEAARTIFYTITVGDYTKEMTRGGRSWTHAAEWALEEIEDWAKLNRDRILA